MVLPSVPLRSRLGDSGDATILPRSWFPARLSALLSRPEILPGFPARRASIAPSLLFAPAFRRPCADAAPETWPGLWLRSPAAGNSARAPGGPPAKQRHKLFPVRAATVRVPRTYRSEEHTSELQSRRDLVCRL